MSFSGANELLIIYFYLPKYNFEKIGLSTK